MSSHVPRSLPVVLTLFFLRTVGYGRLAQALDFRNPFGITWETSLRGALAAGQDVLMKDINALVHLPSPGCPPGSAFRLRSTFSERSNACYVHATSSEFSEAYSPSGRPLEVDDTESWGQGYVMSFIAFADTVVHPFSFSSEVSDDSNDSSPEGDSSLEEIRMHFWMATFIEPYSEDGADVRLEYKCFSSKVPLDAHPVDAAPWSCIKDVHGKGSYQETVEVDPSEFSLHCGCGTIA